jgi:Mg-chelatase subunit ChlD
MTGDEAYVTARSAALVDTFFEMLDRPLRLVKASAGRTDCATVIQAPLHHPEGYLVVEHELSHNLFGSNLQLAGLFEDKAVERLFTRAKIPLQKPEYQPWRHKLKAAIHYLWNILEDHRCCGLWAQLYPEGGRLLKQRWHDISFYEGEEASEKELLAFLCRWASGVGTPKAPKHFHDCERPMTRALNLVEGVDAPACLAITARLVDEIADALLKEVPPEKADEAKKKMEALLSALGNMTSSHEPSEENKLGEEDVQPNEDLPEPTAGMQLAITQVMTAKRDDYDEEGLSSFSALLNSSATRMQDRVEAARQAMSVPKKGEEQKKNDLLTGACIKAGIPGIFVQPVHPLPAPTAAAGRIRTHLDRVRMKARRKLRDEGDDVDVERLIDAHLHDELGDADVFEQKTMEGGMDLLLLLDQSGSMYGKGIRMVEQAVADVWFGVAHERVRVTLWGFSNLMFFYRRVGSPREAQGVDMRGTDMVQALEVAREWAAQVRSQRAVVLMTDGLPTSCRAHGSTGNPYEDLKVVLEEMKKDGVTLSVLAIGSRGMAEHYDRVFGAGRYGLCSDLAGMAVALPETCKALVQAHIEKGNQ